MKIFLMSALTMIPNLAFGQTMLQNDSKQDYWESAWWIRDFAPSEKRKDGNYAYSCTYRSEDSPWLTFNLVYVSNENLVYGCPKEIWYERSRNAWKVKKLR